MEYVNLEFPANQEWLCALCSLLHAMDGHGTPNPGADILLLQALAAPENQFPSYTSRLREKKSDLTKSCQGCANPCGRTRDYTFTQFSHAPQNIQSARLSLLIRLRAAVRNTLQNYPDTDPSDSDIQRFYQALYQVGWGSDENTLLALTRNLSSSII